MNRKIFFHNKTLRVLAKNRYTMNDLKKIENFFQSNDTLKLTAKQNGLYAALNSNDANSKPNYAHTWVRDTIMIVNFQREMKNFESARNTLRALRNYFYKHLFRFKNIIKGTADKNDAMQRPHVRFDGDTLEEIKQKWAHAQNDALGYALWMVFKLCNSDKYSLTDKDYQVWTLFPFYFEAIKFWQDNDSGHWEETRSIKSSSIGTVTAALEEMKKYLLKNQNRSFSCNNLSVSVEFLEKLIFKGKKQLNTFLPYESPPLRKADSALLFLIYPLDIVTDKQSRKILDLVLSDLQGKYGMKRYIGDSYWCAGYKKLLKEEERTADFSTNIALRDKFLKRGQEAQWCVFDSIISVIYGKKYLNNKQEKWLNLQTYYFNRSLSQITEEGFILGGGKYPEAYYIEEPCKGEYVPNDHVPLAWAQVNAGIAFEYMRKSICS